MVQKQNEGIKYELNFKGNNFTDSVPGGKKVWNLPGNTVSNNVSSRKCNNWTYAYYRFSFKKSILKPIFLSNNSGGQELENDGPNIIRKGKLMIHRSSDSKRWTPLRYPKFWDRMIKMLRRPWHTYASRPWPLISTPFMFSPELFKLLCKY